MEGLSGCGLKQYGMHSVSVQESCQENFHLGKINVAVHTFKIGIIYSLESTRLCPQTLSMVHQSVAVVIACHHCIATPACLVIHWKICSGNRCCVIIIGGSRSRIQLRLIFTEKSCKWFNWWAMKNLISFYQCNKDCSGTGHL